MDPLEQELIHALSRKDPSPGFADRVTHAAVADRRVLAFPVSRRAVAAAATLLLAVGGGFAYRRHEGEVAKEQVMTAMRITAVKLNRIQAHVKEARQ